MIVRLGLYGRNIKPTGPTIRFFRSASVRISSVAPPLVQPDVHNSIGEAGEPRVELQTLGDADDALPQAFHCANENVKIQEFVSPKAGILLFSQ